ncbi:hypothetical protein [Cardiobacterium sp. Marseille-Q4385]|uniref:hypothetical protein n=1 Tax=Cardiobacterium sp. Marseille-Q4385 TaxID=2866573 RepID=UPI001CE3BEE0|nr:hypothetical protein [Cardiobacterium sp. Marseille-Q4385]
MNLWQNILYWLSTLTIVIVGCGLAALNLMIYHESNPFFWYEYLFLALVNTAPLQVWLAARWQQRRLLHCGLLCQVVQTIAICQVLLFQHEWLIPYTWIAAIFILAAILIYGLMQRQLVLVLPAIGGLCWFLLNEQEVLAFRTWLAGIFISLFLLGCSLAIVTYPAIRKMLSRNCK